MKKKLKIVLIVVAVLLVIGLVWLNRSLSDSSETGRLEVVLGGEAMTYAFSEENDGFETFTARMTRKNGETRDRNFGGIPLSAILEQAGAAKPQPDSTVTVVCTDNYEITLTGAEVLAHQNIYLVSTEDGQPLDAESGPFMMVVLQDEFSTRWARNIVRVRVDA